MRAFINQITKGQSQINAVGFFAINSRLIPQVTNRLNNTFLNDIEILKQHQNKKFDSFTDSEKGVILR